VPAGFSACKTVVPLRRGCAAAYISRLFVVQYPIHENHRYPRREDA
jgi:hypothetical protein